jgi:hypothetical protein
MLADEEVLAKKLEGGNETGSQTGNETTEEEPSEEVDESEYPQGARLIFVVVALVLSIFLVSLDLVSPSRRRRHPIPREKKVVVLTETVDDRRYCDPQNHRRVPRP